MDSWISILVRWWVGGWIGWWADGLVGWLVVVLTVELTVEVAVIAEAGQERGEDRLLCLLAVRVARAVCTQSPTALPSNKRQRTVASTRQHAATRAGIVCLPRSRQGQDKLLGGGGGG